jgi:3-hydroxy acid dehydrogenase/malonic semialdehyde reductase
MPVAIISGASSGFGKACADIFARNGHDLVLVARREDRLLELADQLTKEHSVQILVRAIDVRDKEAVDRAFGGWAAPYEKADVLVNNAGLAVGRNTIDEGFTDDWDRMIDTNVKGLLYVTKAAMPYLKAAKGHIINVGNVYCASKHAVTALSKGMRIDLVKHGIKVTNISPGLAETEFSMVRFKGDKDKADAVYQGFQPLSAGDVADVIWFAASRPAHVNLEEITILPTAQADSRIVHRG